MQSCLLEKVCRKSDTIHIEDMIISNMAVEAFWIRAKSRNLESLGIATTGVESNGWID